MKEISTKWTDTIEYIDQVDKLLDGKSKLFSCGLLLCLSLNVLLLKVLIPSFIYGSVAV
jgi:hypothetical protein